MSDNNKIEINEQLKELLFVDTIRWAKNFVMLILANPAIATDEKAMRDWFANAFIAGYEAASDDLGSISAFLNNLYKVDEIDNDILFDITINFLSDRIFVKVIQSLSQEKISKIKDMTEFRAFVKSFLDVEISNSLLNPCIIHSQTNYMEIIEEKIVKSAWVEWLECQ